MGNWCCKGRCGLETDVSTDNHYDSYDWVMTTPHSETYNSSSDSDTDDPPLYEDISIYNDIAQNQPTSPATTQHSKCYSCKDLESAAFDTCIEHYVEYANCNRYLRNEFHVAAEKGHSNIIRLLAQPMYDIDINGFNFFNQTPLIVSAKHGNIECLIILLKCGVNTEPKDFIGKTAMDYALENKCRGK